MIYISRDAAELQGIYAVLQFESELPWWSATIKLAQGGFLV